MPNILAVQGRPILAAASEGWVGESGSGDVSDIIVAAELTVPVAREAIRTSSLVVTCGGNFACHGANLLRAARATGSPVGWVAGISLPAGQAATVSMDGWVSAPRVSACSRPVPEDLYEYSVGSREWVGLCLWPDRRYGDLELHLQLAGLGDCMSALAEAPVVPYSREGRIFYSRPALSNQDILRLMLSSAQYRSTWYERMRADYDQLLAMLRARPNPRPDQTEEMARLFFRSLLPTHRTYGQLLQTEAHDASSDPQRGELLLDAALRGPIVRWLHSETRFVDSVKRLNSSEWGDICPADSATELIAETLSELQASGHADRWANPAVERLATLATLKELKMVISKNLFARFGRESGRITAGVDVDAR